VTVVIDGIDLANPDNFIEGVPFEWFRRLRQEAPVAWHREPGPNAGFWAVTRYDDLVSIHMDWATFSSEIGAVSLEELDSEQLDIRRSMLETDPPPHGLRSITLEALRRAGWAVRGLDATWRGDVLGARSPVMKPSTSSARPGAPVRISARCLLSRKRMHPSSSRGATR
jgi:hypothetical protein